MDATGSVFNAPFFNMSDAELVESFIRKALPNTSRSLVYRIVKREHGDVYTKVTYELAHGAGVKDGPTRLH